MKYKFICAIFVFICAFYVFIFELKLCVYKFIFTGFLPLLSSTIYYWPFYVTIIFKMIKKCCNLQQTKIVKRGYIDYLSCWKCSGNSSLLIIVLIKCIISVKHSIREF